MTKIVDGKVINEQEDELKINFNQKPFNPNERDSLNIIPAGQLGVILKPTGILSFIWHQDESIKFDFIVRKIDPMTTGVIHDTMIVRSLVRIKQYYDMTPKDVENMSPEEVTELFNVDRKIQDSHNADIHLCTVASYAILDPPIAPSEIIHEIPMSWIKIIADWAQGGIDEEIDLVDGFRVQVTSPKGP